MANSSRISDEQILADFFGIQPHSTESENDQSTSQNQAVVMEMRPKTVTKENTRSEQNGEDETDREETAVEIYDESEESNSSEMSETQQNPSQVFPSNQAFSQSPIPNLGKQSSERATKSAPLSPRVKCTVSGKRPSTSKSFRGKLKRPDSKKVKAEVPAPKNIPRGSSKSAPSTRHRDTEYVQDFQQAQRPSTGRPRRSNLSAAGQETVIEVDGSTEEASSSTPSRIGSAKLAVRNRLANLIKAEMTMRGMKDDVRRSLFAPSLQILETTLFLGSLVFMVPFTIQIRNGEYAIEGGILRTALTGILILSSILLHATTTYASIKMTTVRAVSSVTNSVDQIAILLILLAFGYSVLFCRSRFRSLFETFGIKFFRQSDPLNRQWWKMVLWALFPFLFCITIGNWTAWGVNFHENGAWETFDSYRDNGIGQFLVARRIISENNSQTLIIALQLFLRAYAHCIVMYTEMLLWAASLSIYWMEKKKRAYCTQDRVVFDLVEGTSVFHDLHEVVNRRLSRPLGPLLAVSCISLVTYNVSGLTTLCFGVWSWHIPIIMMIKAGHVLVAAEATANDENLLHQILSKRLCPPPLPANGDEEASHFHNRFTYESQLREFKDAARDPMVLKALDFANMNYALFGWVLVSAIGYFLVVAEWFKAEYSEGSTKILG